MATLQSAVFSRLHTELLKPVGFRKVAARSERSFGQLHQAVVPFSSRFNSATSVTFTLEYRVAHEAFFHLFQPGKPFPGLTEKFMPLLSWRPLDLVTGNEVWWHLPESSGSNPVETEIIEVVERQALPALELTKSPEGIVEFCAGRRVWRDFLPHSWALYYQGNAEAAHRVVSDAIAQAPHENARKVAREWQARIGG